MDRIAVLASGRGSNLQALIDHINQTRNGWRIECILSDTANAAALQRAHKHDIPSRLITHQDPVRQEQSVMQELEAREISLICLAGYMRVLSPPFVQAYAGRILNIHPSLLPKYPGLHTHRRVLEAGEHEHGCSVHFVTEELDAGPVIVQARLNIQPDETEATLADRVLALEHQIYPQAVDWFTQGQLRIEGDTVYLNGQPQTEPMIHAPK